MSKFSEIHVNLAEILVDIVAEILTESVIDAFLMVSTSISTSHLSPGVDLHFSPGVDLFFGQSPSSPFTKFSVIRLSEYQIQEGHQESGMMVLVARQC